MIDLFLSLLAKVSLALMIFALCLFLIVCGSMVYAGIDLYLLNPQ